MFFNDSQPDSQCINRVHSISYLGGLFSDDGTIGSELGNRIGLACSDFSFLKHIWSHAYISCKRKVSLFNILVLSKLMYALDTKWLSKCEINRLNAVQNKCLRRILKIDHSFYSRISNHEVLQRANTIPLSNTLLRRQLKLFGQMTYMSPSTYMRQFVFDT